MSENKRFEDWVKVDCNECARYWDSSCDGSQGSQKPCNSFSATRSVVIPAKLNELEKKVESLRTQVLLLVFANIVCGLSIIMLVI